MAEGESRSLDDPIVLDLSKVEVGEPPPMPARVLLPEAMLGYACNRKGCCCRGWTIHFKVKDLARLDRGLEEQDRGELQHDIDFDVQPDAEGTWRVEGFFLPGDWGACRFLEEAGGCRVHAKYGPDVMPDLCINFPTTTYTEEDAAVLVFDAVCPSVLERLEPGRGSLRLVEHPAPAAEPQTARRARNTRGGRSFWVGDLELTAAQRAGICGRIAEWLEGTDAPAWRALRDVEHSLGRIAARERAPEAFAVERGGDDDGFRAHLRRSAAHHDGSDLERSLLYYRRFVPWLQAETLPWQDAVASHLDDWEVAAARWLAPAEQALRPFFLRWFALVFSTPHGNAPGGDLRRLAGMMSHTYAHARRVAAALAASLERVADPPVAQAAAGFATYCFRSAGVPEELPEWFGAPVD